ncbi:LytTR family DNA-binding domain-containing protein [Sphingobacterium sp. HMA12]|uniref:LytTR family DNA-binding domain-containing protein n=1 Tax=Sphingobacterium sp. HMA12 TaxID=2050894 RepID=UPI000CEA4400|nr:LytTR family DNA-binding domain-containing protein [Sphingobacterium sp. HMA12]
MINLNRWFRQQQQVIPGIFSLRTSLRYAFLLGGSCYLFLIIFQPFGTYNFEDAGKYILLMGYGGIFTLSYLFTTVLLSSGKEWTLKKEFLRMLLVYVAATILNFLYNSCIVSRVPMQWINLLYMGLYTLSLYVPIGLIYFLALIKTDRGRLTTPVSVPVTLSPVLPIRVSLPAQRISHPTAHTPTAPLVASLADQYAVVSDNSTMVCLANGSQLLYFGQQDFIFAKSMDNYCEVYFYENKIAKKEIIRITLGKLAEQLTDANIHRCHRSYLVNFDKILAKEGNAKGFVLRFADRDEYALVSRSMLPAVKAYLLK